MSDSKMLEELKSIINTLGIELRLVSGELGNGLCKINGDNIFLLNRNLQTQNRIKVLSRALSRIDLSMIYLLPAVRYRLKQERQQELLDKKSLLKKLT